MKFKVKPKRSDYEEMVKNINDMETAQNIFYPANERGYADHGWLKARHSFSFAGWYDPDKVHFGVLRVLNDDIVAQGMGFPTHPHDNMEIITIPLKGGVYHEDNMGNSGEIKSGEVQVMSAGTGVMHSEYNKNADEELNLFQIWIFPNKRNVQPRYDQQKIQDEGLENDWVQIVSPNESDAGVWIHQNAWIQKGHVSKDQSLNYTNKREGNGSYLMVIEGKVKVDGLELGKRDAIGVPETKELIISAMEDSKVLLLDVPMNLEENA